MHHLFISDVHIGAFEENKEKQIEKDLISLIDYCEKNSILLHVLGDLFDYWMEYPDYTPSLGRNILTRFKTYHQNVGRTFFLTGNHDYWTLGAFEEHGFDVESDQAVIAINNSSVFLMHGDGIADTLYNMPRPLLNRFLRNHFFITLFRSALSGKRANSVMKWFSEYTRNPLGGNPDTLNKWAHQLISEYKFDVVISGHDHIARKETFSDGIYINCGAFHKNYTLAEYKNNEPELVIWNSHQNKLLPFKTDI